MARRRLDNLPEKTQERIRLMVADLLLLHGIVPGRDPERLRAYRKVKKKIDEAIKRFRLDPDEVYFIYGQNWDPDAKQRAFDYIRERRPELVDLPEHLTN